MYILQLRLGTDCKLKGGNGITSDKVPTEISYQLDANTKPIADVTPEQNPIAGASTLVRWGFMHKPDENRIKCIKLFLDRNQKLPHFVRHLVPFLKLYIANGSTGQSFGNSNTLTTMRSNSERCSLRLPIRALQA